MRLWKKKEKLINNLKRRRKRPELLNSQKPQSSFKLINLKKLLHKRKRRRDRLIRVKRMTILK
jgi:hypothetical protein